MVGNGVGNSGCHWLVGGERGGRGNNCCWSNCMVGNRCSYRLVGSEGSSRGNHWSNCLVGNMLGNNWLVGSEGGRGVGKGRGEGGRDRGNWRCYSLVEESFEVQMGLRVDGKAVLSHPSKTKGHRA